MGDKLTTAAPEAAAPQVLEALTEEECYLYAILTDDSGLDQAEFLWFSPDHEDGCFRAWAFQWCLAGETEIFTDSGRRTLSESVGPVRLLTAGEHDEGRWVDAEVKSFGPGVLWRIELERQGVRRTLWATKDHRHFASSQPKSERRVYAEKTTADLSLGDYLQPIAAPHVAFSVDRDAVCAGIVHGDGTVYRDKARVRLWGGKKTLVDWFEGYSSSVPPSQPESLYVGSLPVEWKTWLPTPGVDGVDQLWGWLAGYFATDGSVLPDGTCQITSTNLQVLSRVRDIATVLGIEVSGVGHQYRECILPNGKEHSMTVGRVVLRRADLPLAFFLLPSHRERVESLDVQRPRSVPAWRVVEIEPHCREDEVFCAVVPGTHSFAIDGGILTGNSWYRCNNALQIDQCARALSLDTMIATPSGWTTMGELRPGDEVFDERGHPTTVKAVSQIWTDRDCYEVLFDDHTSVVADAEHLWMTWDKKARAARSSKRRGIAKPNIRTTQEIAETLTYGSEKNHAIDVTAPLCLPDVELPLDPYFVGYWLGNGTTLSSEITTADKWVLDEFRRRGFTILDRVGSLRYGLAFPEAHNRKTESVQAIMRSVGILGNKHVPEMYLRSSEAQRRDIVAGLVDSDGYIQANGSCEVTQKQYAVAAGLVELLRSLGEKPRIVKKTAYLNGVDCGPVYRVTWRPRSNPARLPRKAERFTQGGRVSALSQRRIVDVRKVESRPVRCITVDSPSHLFLAGEAMVPTHNSVGKSMSIKVRAFAFPFVHPGNEMLITAPELVHLEPIVSLIEQQVYATRLSSELVVQGRSGVTHRPFQMNFSNGARIIGRIPQRDGRGVKGVHPLWLELDEAQDYPHAGWVELTETLKRGFEGAVWRAHGVTRGLRDDFYEHTQDSPDNEWTVHRFAAMWRPNWTDQERTEKIKQYGSRDDPDYRRNVLGLHGDATNPMFVLTRLMATVDDEPHSEYNEDEYFQENIKTETLTLMKQRIVEVMDYPPRHRSYLPKATFWCGMDVGFTVDPSEIVTFVEYREKGDERSKLKLLSRMHLERIGTGEQMRAVLHTINFYRPRAFSMDKTGNGLPLYQQIQEWAEEHPEDSYMLDIIKGYNFSQKVTVGFDDSIIVDEYKGDPERDAGIRRQVLEYASDTLRTLVDEKRIVLPWDADLLKQFQGSTWTAAQGAQDQYGRRIYSRGNDHILDACRMAVLGWKQYAIEEVLKAPKDDGPVLDMFLG